MKLWIDGERIAAVGEGNGPVNALDAAVRQALADRYPALDADPPHRLQGAGARRRRRHRRGGTGAHRLHRRRAVWTTVGVHSNVIEASWQALVDSLVFGLLRAEH